MFCRGCGASLPEALALPVEHAAQGPAWGCQACRHENAAHYAFCLGCGAARGAGAPPQRMMGYEGNPGAAPGQRSPVVLILVLVIVVLVLIGGIGAGAAMFLVR